jgi:two-component system nitrate/nitrite response regulator NarL
MLKDKTNIIIIEDEPLLRHSFVSVINQSSNYVVVGEYEDLKEAIKRIHQFPNLIILLDVHLHGVKTVDSINMLKRINPYNKIIMLSSDSSYQTIVDCIRNGADGYLVKEDAVLALGSFLNQSIQHDYVLSPTAANSMCNFVQSMSFTHAYHTEATKDPTVDLTTAQKLVYRELIRGKSYQAIAENLGISRNTVAQHVQRIYKTLEINSRAELMAGTNQLQEN